MNENSSESQPSVNNILASFKSLNTENRISTLNAIIDICETDELNYLSERLEDFLKRDFLRFLPDELCTYLLSFLDDATLGKCCSVSRTWNSVVSNSQFAWMRCCHSVGWKIDESIKDGKYWKQVYYKALERKQQLKEGSAFNHNTLVGHNARVYTVKYHGCGLLASGSDDRQIRLWDVQTGECLRVVTAHACADLAFNEYFVLTASFDNTIAKWDWDTGQRNLTYNGHTGAVFSIDFDEDRDLLISGSADKTVRLWQLSTGEQVNMLHGHTEWVTKVLLDISKVDSIHHNVGDHVILSMDKIEIRLWHINHEINMTSLHIFTIHKDRPDSGDYFLLPQLVFDGRRILCSSEQGVIEWNFADFSLTRIISNSNAASFLVGVGDAIFLTADTYNDCLLIRVCGKKSMFGSENRKCHGLSKNDNSSKELEKYFSPLYQCVQPTATSIDDPVELEICGDAPNQSQATQNESQFRSLHLDTSPRLLRVLSSPNEYSPNMDNENNNVAISQNKQAIWNYSNMKDLLGHCQLPTLRWSKRGSNFVCGDTNWLNGFTHSNNEGLVFAAALPNHSIYLVNWKKWK